MGDNMSNIEIHDLNELINSNYPQSFVEKLINDVLLLSLEVKTDYPDYKQWYTTIHVPGLYDSTRNIIIAHIKDKIVGFVSLKKTKEEKKICTFYVEKRFQKNKIGTILVERAITYLEEEKPLITIPLDKLHEFTRIGRRLGWQITDIKENLYRVGSPEVIVNGNLAQETITQNKEIKQLVRQYRIQKIKTLLQNLKLFLSINQN